MLVWVFLEGASVNSQGASIPLEEGLWGPAGRASEPGESGEGRKAGWGYILESLWAKDVSGMCEKPSRLIPVRTVPPAGSHQPEAAHRGMASFAPMGLRAVQLEPLLHRAPCAGHLGGGSHG